MRGGYKATVSISDTGSRAEFENGREHCIVSGTPLKVVPGRNAVRVEFPQFGLV